MKPTSSKLSNLSPLQQVMVNLQQQGMVLSMVYIFCHAPHNNGLAVQQSLRASLDLFHFCSTEDSLYSPLHSTY